MCDESRRRVSRAAWRLEKGRSRVDHGIEIPKDRIAQFCLQWKIKEFALFGSVPHDDFRPDMQVSDPDAARLWDMLVHAEEIAQTLEGLGFDECLGDRNLRLATERVRELIDVLRPLVPPPPGEDEP